MNRKAIPYLLLAAILLLTLVGLGWQRQVASRLKDELARQQASAAERSRLQTEHARLTATQVTPAEDRRRREERERVTGLLTEIEGMRRRANQAAKAAITAPSMMPLPARADIRERAVPVAEWRNAGQSDPVATIETALWAAAGGDLDALAATMLLDDGSRQKAAELFARQPAALQREVGSPEKLIALLAAKDVPLGTAQVLTELSGPEQTKLTVRAEGSDGSGKTVMLRLKPDGKNWRVVVPSRTVDEYVSPTRPNAMKLDPLTVATPTGARP